MSEQSYGANPTEKRDTDHYKAEYVQSFVEKWDELIDWDKRAASEGAFFIERLRARGVNRVLDAATGTGFHSIQLMKAGFDVVSADGSPEMLARAFANGRKHGLILRTVQADWRWLNRDVAGRFDAVICLGNSFTHLFSEKARRKALAEFYSALRHDGILLLDQRNYDAMLDRGYSTKHRYYYCGNCEVEPAHLDSGLARFQYAFSDGTTYHLNMFPLRAAYVRRLMADVGFQRTETFGDFQSTYRDGDPDFLVHVADKRYMTEEEAKHEPRTISVAPEASDRARSYYDSSDADRFYSMIWGGEDIHVGVYERDDEAIADASRRTVATLVERAGLRPGASVIDLGAGYGGAARLLAREHDCRVVAINVSRRENERHRELNREAGLESRIDVRDAVFEQLEDSPGTFDVVWSQDAILHSGDRRAVLEEALRVLKPGGVMVFTDPMQSATCNQDMLAPILARIDLESLGSPAWYLSTAREVGFAHVEFVDETAQLVKHYRRVHEELMNQRQQLLDAGVSEDYLTSMASGLDRWVEGGVSGNLAWGFFRFEKAAQ